MGLPVELAHEQASVRDRRVQTHNVAQVQHTHFYTPHTAGIPAVQLVPQWDVLRVRGPPDQSPTLPSVCLPVTSDICSRKSRRTGGHAPSLVHLV